MDITLYISRFLHRIRYQLILGTLVVTALVAYFTQFMQKKYTVSTSIYINPAKRNVALCKNDTCKNIQKRRV